MASYSSNTSNRKTITNLLFQSVYIVKLEEIKQQINRAQQLQENMISGCDDTSQITTCSNYHTYTNPIISEGIEYYENYQLEDRSFEEVNPLTEISTDKNNVIITSNIICSQNCSVQTDAVFIVDKQTSQIMQNEMEELKQKIVEFEKEKEIIIHSFTNDKIEKNTKKIPIPNISPPNVINFMFKTFPRQKVIRPMTI